MMNPPPRFDHTDAAKSPMLARVAHIDRTLEWKRDMLARANGEYACELEQDIKILEHDREWLLGQPAQCMCECCQQDLPPEYCLTR